MKALEDYAEEMRWDFTWEEAAEYLGDISPETLRRHAKISGWRTMYGRILPLLSPSHQERRLEWAHDHRRSTWNDWVDLDEKWFYTIVVRKKKVPPSMKAPSHSTQSKRFIGKTMFLTAVAIPRPQYGFDGLIGIWRICEKTTAKRKSKLRPKCAVVRRMLGVGRCRVSPRRWRDFLEWSWREITCLNMIIITLAMNRCYACGSLNGFTIQPPIHFPPHVVITKFRLASVRQKMFN